MLSAEAQTSPPTPSSQALVPSPHTASTIPRPPSPSPSPSALLVSLPIKLLELIFKNCDTYALQQLRLSCKTLSPHIPAFLFKTITFSLISYCPFPNKFIKHVESVRCDESTEENASLRQKTFTALTEFLKRFHPSQLKTLTLLPFPTYSRPIIWQTLHSLMDSLECLVFSLGEKEKFPTTIYDRLGYVEHGFEYNKEWDPKKLVDVNNFWSRLRKIDVTINNYISNNDILTLEVFALLSPNLTTYYLNYDFRRVDLKQNVISVIPLSVTNIRLKDISLTKLQEILGYLVNLQSIDHFILSDDRTESLLAKSFANIRYVNFEIQHGARKHLFEEETWKPVFPNAKIMVKPQPQKIHLKEF